MAISSFSRVAASLRFPICARPLSTAKNWKGLNLRIPFPREGGLNVRSVNAHPSSGVIQLPFESLMAPGFGINSLNGQSTGAQVVDFKSIEVLKGADATVDGQNSKPIIKVVQSAQELFEQTSATMSAGASFGPFSGSAKANRSNVTNFNSQATHIFASNSVVNALQYCDGVKLKEEARRIAEEDPQEFFSRFGDSYVQGLIRGGYYIAHISVVSESREIQTKLAGSIKAGLDGFGSGAGSFSAETKAYAKFSNIDIQIIQQGGLGEDHSNSLGGDLNKLSEKINNFASIILQHPVTFAVIASPYQSLVDFPKQGHGLIDRSQQRAHLEQYEMQRADIVSLQRSLQLVQANPQLFKDPPSPEQLNEWQQKLSEQQNQLEELAQNCAADVRECKAIAFTLPEGFKMPERLDSVIEPEESRKLGTVWQGREGDWTGTWKRIGQSRIFEAKWTKPVQGPISIPILEQQLVETALLKIHIQGNAVHITRTNSQSTVTGPLEDMVRGQHPETPQNKNIVSREGDCIYTGILEPGGKVTGNYKCPWGPKNSWSATIL